MRAMLGSVVRRLCGNTSGTTFSESQRRGEMSPSIFPDYQSAHSASDAHGYASGDIVEVVRRKTRRLRDELLEGRHAYRVTSHAAYCSLGLLTVASSPKSLTVVDFGGGCGVHYFLLRALLPRDFSLRWTVVETPEMALAGNTLANDELTFSSDLESAAAELGRIDVVHSAGALQCCEAPLAWLQRLMAIGAQHALLTRLALTNEEQEIVAVARYPLSQNLPGPLPEGIVDRTVSHPFTVLPQRKFIELYDRSFKRVFEFEDQSGVLNLPGRDVFGFAVLGHRRAKREAHS